MSRQLSERELKRVNRTLSGHARDKDRQRWKRKVAGQAPPAAARRKAERDDATLEGPDDTGGAETE